MNQILILGGTGLARKLATALSEEQAISFVTSLAGRTQKQLPIDGPVISGGFGGVEGLSNFLIEQNITHIVDATHPYAQKISTSAVQAAQQTGLPLCRLVTPAWQPGIGDIWHSYASEKQAAAALPVEAKVLVTTGHKGLAEIVWRRDVVLHIRLIEPPSISLPDHCTVILNRPPYSLTQEKRLFESRQITHLMTKNAGGDATRSKLLAAAELGTTVLMIERAPEPDVLTFRHPAEVISWIKPALS